MHKFSSLLKPLHRLGLAAAWSGAVPVMLMWASLHAAAQTVSPLATQDSQAASGPYHLRQPAQGMVVGGAEAQPDAPTAGGRVVSTDRRNVTGTEAPSAYFRSEFEAYANSLPGVAGDIRRFGHDLTTWTPGHPSSNESSPVVPPDYVIQPGDELVLTLWGSVDADIRLTVDRSGTVSIPRIGPVMVSGVRYSDLSDTISRRVALVFKNFQLSVSLGRLRGVRVYVTGFVPKPGMKSMSSLSTLAQALIQAGGPAYNGSFRNVQLRRGRDLVATLDLYDLLLKGDRSADRLVQADDVIHVGAVGTQVALIGSFNRPAIYELKPGETLSDAMRMAGGLSAVADPSRVSIERLNDRVSVRVSELPLPASLSSTLRDGDVLRAFSAVNLVLPVQGQNRRVKVEGEVLRPGEYVLPAGATLTDALRAAGGLASSAFLFGADLSRESVRKTQLANYERALRDLEIDLARTPNGLRATGADDTAAQSQRQVAANRVIDQLRSVKPTGRIVLELPVSGGSLPDIAVEDGDRLYIPARPTSVGVFGRVFNAGNYVFGPTRSIDDYLRLAGGPTRGADSSSTFVVRANGTVISRQQMDGFLSWGNPLGAMRAEPGDTIFVPEEFDRTTLTQLAKDWTQVLYQLGLGAAGVKALGVF